MGIYLQRAPGGVAGEPDPAGAGIRGDKDPRREDFDGLFQLWVQLEAALAAGGRGKGHLQFRRHESGGLRGRGAEIRPDRSGALLYLYRQLGPAACDLV